MKITCNRLVWVRDLPHEAGISRSLVVITDGYISAEKEAFDYIRDNLGQANIFSFGIGSSVNRYLIEGVAKAGMGDRGSVRCSLALQMRNVCRELKDFPVVNLVNHSHIRVAIA